MEKRKRTAFMPKQLTLVAFDADDTLWHNERFFRLTQERFAELLSDHADSDHLAERLLMAEKRNIGRYGFGVKGFVLSMIETAIEVTNEKVPARVIAELIEAGHDMLAYPIELLPHAQDAVEAIAETHRVILVTKGDLLDQERKLAQSGLGDLFDGVEIVSSKTPTVYQSVFDRHGDGPDQSMMVGNSMRSDVVPVIQSGGWGVYVPHGLVWEIEHAEPPTGAPRYHAIDDLAGLAGLVEEID
jgi:putative hydrolase of the HAD superfamily